MIQRVDIINDNSQLTQLLGLPSVYISKDIIFHWHLTGK